MKKIRVALTGRGYNIYTGYNILARLGKIMPCKRGAIITDRKVKRIWGRAVDALNLPLYSLAPGERSKSLDTAKQVYRQLLKWGLDRNSCLIAFGGGVVGDLTGFVAATYMRGIKYIQVPTTLMAQVDSSIGGKTAVNLPEGKNLVGCFYQPEFVLSDVKVLSTLNESELKNGLAEVVKYGMIKDKGLFEYLEQKGSRVLSMKAKEWEMIVARCAAIKAGIVTRDEKETRGIRDVLNYGHTIGHAIETAGKYRRINHGKAVAAGMIYAGKLAVRKGFLSTDNCRRQDNLIAKLIGPGKVNLDEDILDRIKYDKKRTEDKTRFVLADRIGHVKTGCRIKEEELKELME